MGFVFHTVRWTGRGVPEGWSYSGSGDRPWGFDEPAIHVEQVNDRLSLLVAPTGRRYETMRDLFADFRLRLCACDRQVDPLEQLHRALRAIDLEMLRVDPQFAVDGVWEGSRGYMEQHVHWMEMERMIECEGSTFAGAVLSKEGHAALHMLDLTALGSNVDASPAAIARMQATRTLPERPRSQ